MSLLVWPKARVSMLRVGYTEWIFPELLRWVLLESPLHLASPRQRLASASSSECRRSTTKQ